MYEDILEGKKEINGLVTIVDGYIKGNPFSKAIGDNKAARWILENRGMVEGKLRKEMLSYGLGVHELDECYDYAIYFFLEKDGRDFDEDYFGKDVRGTYTLAIYCMSRLREVVWLYKEEMKERMDSTVYLVGVDDMEDGRVGHGCITDGGVSSSMVDVVVDEYDDIVEFEDMQEVLDKVLPMYDEDFRMKGLLNFSTRDFVYHLFLSEDGIELDGRSLKMTSGSYKEVAGRLGLEVATLRKVYEYVKKLVREDDGDIFRDLFENIYGLVEAKKKGWRPVY